PYKAIVDGWLEADAGAPRKQRHTARRIHQRLVAEHGATVSERQVDRYVAARRREIGEGEAFVPPVPDAGPGARRGWGAGPATGRGEPRKVHLFLMRACHSGAAYVTAFEAETQQAFLEGHVGAFAFLRRRLRDDPLRQPEGRRRPGDEGPPAGGVRP